MRWTPLLMISLLFALTLPLNGAETTQDGGIIISEIFPNPPGSDLSSEYIELKNTGSGDVSLLNWTLSDQDGPVDFIFPNITLHGGERALIYVGSGENRTENDTAYFYMWRSSSMLNNDGDDVLLCDSEGNPVDYVAYGSGNYVDSPPDGIVWDEKLDAREALALERSSDTGDWFWGMPTPGLKNPDFLSSAPLEISSFYPCARYGDEFVEIRNTGDGYADISGFYMSDGEGYLYFPEGTVIPADSSIYVTQNLSGFLGEMGFAPDLVYDECYTPSHYPQLSNSGDEIFLYSPSGHLIFSVSYGEGAELQIPAKGEVYYHDGSWKLRRIGRSSFPVFHIAYSGSLTAFSSPESSLKTLVNEIDNAHDEILVNTYQFKSQEVAQALLRAISRGVDVKVLVEGGPVGGIPEEEIAVLRALSSAGADVRLMDNNNRYSFDHAKYMVIDSKSLIILSENLNGDAMPVEGSGNRGWGVIIRNGSAANYMKRIFSEDFNLNFSDISRFGMEMSSAVEWRPSFPEGQEGASINGSFNISIIPGPEHGLDEIIQEINSAEKSVYIEQFYITYRWGDDENSLISAVLNASLRGCDVRVLLDGSYYNTDDEFDNDELAEFLNEFGKEHGVNLSAKVIDLGKHGLVKVHNKGMIIDGKTTLISSFNWGENSFENNRELEILVENEDVTSYFTSLFMEDWKSDFEAPAAIIDGNNSLLVNHSYEFESGSYDDTGIVSYLWSLDGMEISDNSTLTLNFSSPGAHILELSVRDAEGNENSTSMRIEVRESRSPEYEFVDSDESEDAYKSPEREKDTETASEPPDSGSSGEIPEEKGNPIMQYLVAIFGLAILISAIKISWKRESHGS